MAVLVLSRFALLPSGPWDWDETLFARGILDFDLPAHFPHPPGFPLWVFLGWITHFFVSEPLVGLQLLSATASCLTLWPLVALGRRIAPAPVATAAALVVLFAPGVWLHAPRGFSCTPATLFALWAAALALRPAQSRPVTIFTCLVTAAFLIRPILLPSLAVLWLAGVWAVTPRRRLLPGVTIGLAATALAIVGMVFAQGSWSEFARSFVVHGRRHTRNLLGNVGGFAELGIVKGLGGPVLACLLAVVVVVGLLVWFRREGRRSTLAWVAVFTVGIGQLIWLQNRTFSRYAVPYQMAAAPLVAGAAALVPPAIATGALLASAASFAATSFSAVVEQHTRLLPGWEALRRAADIAAVEGHDLLVEPGLYPFASYLTLADRAAKRDESFRIFLAPSSPDARELPPRRYLLVTDLPRNYLPTTWERRFRWDEVGKKLRPLTSGRFLHAEIIDGAAVPIVGFWPPERSGGESFMWGGPQAELLLPPLTLEGPLGLELSPAPGSSPLIVRLNGLDVARIPGDAPRLTLPLDPAMISATATNRLAIVRERGYPPGGGDIRPLAVRVFPLTALRETSFGGLQQQLAATLAKVDSTTQRTFPASGLHRPEVFPVGRGAWTRAEATLSLPLASGLLVLTVWAPRPGPVDLRIDLEDTLLAGPLVVGSHPQAVHLFLTGIPEGAAPTRVTLRSRAYVPATEGAGDNRELGVVLGQIQFTPTAPDVRGWLAVPDRSGTCLLWAPLPADPSSPPPASTWQQVAEGDGVDRILGVGSLMALPANAPGDRYLLDVAVPPAATAALVEIDGLPSAVLSSGTPRLLLDLPSGPPGDSGPSVLAVQRARSGPGQVAVHLHSVAVRRWGGPWGGPVARPNDRARLGVKLVSAVASGRPLGARGLHEAEEFPFGRGAWTFPHAELTLPAAGRLLRLTLAAPRPTAPELGVRLNDEPLAGPLAIGPEPHEILITLPPVPPDGASTLRLGLSSVAYSPPPRGAPHGRDLGVVLLRSELEASPGDAVAGWVIAPPDAGSTWTMTTYPRGAYNPERFGETEGCWTVPQALLIVPPGDGVLTITAWAARPQPAQLEIWHDGHRLIGPLDLPDHPTQLPVSIRGSPPYSRETLLELRAAPYSPRRHSGHSDDRELGVILSHLTFQPGK